MTSPFSKDYKGVIAAELDQMAKHTKLREGRTAQRKAHLKSEDERLRANAKANMGALSKRVAKSTYKD